MSGIDFESYNDSLSLEPLDLFSCAGLGKLFYFCKSDYVLFKSLKSPKSEIFALLPVF
jgi:hypothetical protein